MNLGQLKTKTLQIIREYSNNGSIIGTGQNADYLLSMNSFINDAQFELSSIRPIVKRAALGTPIEETQLYKRYAMPSDFMGFKELKNYDYTFTDFDWEGKVMMIPKGYDGNYVLIYYALPTFIDNATPDSKDLEIDVDLQMIIPYFVAGHVMIDENPPLAEFFLNEYSMKKKITTIPQNIKIENVFGW